MKLTILYNIGEGPVEVTTNLATIVAWERRYKRKISHAERDGLGIEDMAFLAHEASKQRQITVPAVLDDFIRRLEDLEIVSGEQANPTQGTPTGEDSPSS